ncbi:MAG TPA: four helix bundle protein [Vicinamibacterales bacterium]|nr:four helix bundle protein [Vicinamibacterales bacterium]
MNKPLESFQSRSFRFACAIVRAYMKLAKLPARPPHLARQVLRAGTSIGANLEEHNAAHSRADAASRVSIALKEARETSYWLRLLLATDLAPKTLLEPLVAEAGELIAILTVTRRRLKEEAQG